MRIIFQTSPERRRTLHIPLGFLATRAGALVAAGLYNMHRRHQAALPDVQEADGLSLTMADDAKVVTTHSQTSVSAAQIRQFFLSLKKSGYQMRLRGLPLIEINESSGEYIRIDL